MRKILVVLTLIVSSFFIFKNNVKADTTILEVRSVDYDLINDDFFTIRDKVITFANENNKYYLIYANQYGNFKINFFDSSDLKIFQSSKAFNVNLSSAYEIYTLSNDNLSKSGSGTDFNYTLYNTAVLLYYNLLDTNVENLIYTGTNSYIIKHNDLSYLVEPGDNFPTLYQIYLDENKSPEEPPVEDDEVIVDDSLNSFYSLIMEKIQLFANYFINNNILLFVIGIFILIFIIELIRRYLL